MYQAVQMGWIRVRTWTFSPVPVFFLLHLHLCSERKTLRAPGGDHHGNPSAASSLLLLFPPALSFLGVSLRKSHVWGAGVHGRL